MGNKLLTSLKLGLLVLMLYSLTGCWSSSNIQDQHYTAAIGIDFDGENYILYAQTLNFASIASTEGAQGTTPDNSSYVGIGVGKSMHLAASDLYKAAQLRIEWGHTQAVIVSERALMAKDSELVDRVYRFPDNRYNVWFFVTQEPIDKLLESDTFYNFTTLRTIIHMPESSYNQTMTLPPIQMFKYLSFVNEPDRLSYVPCLGFNETSWESQTKQLKLPVITAGYFASDKVKKMIKIEDIKGYRWAQPKLTRTMLLVKDEKKDYAVVIVHKAKVKKKAVLVDGQVKFNIEASYRGSMDEYIEEIDYEDMIKLAEEQIKQEIIETYNFGVEEELDFFNLMHSFRMKNPSRWKQMTKNGQEFILTKNSINEIKVKLVVSTNGKYKRQK